MTMNVHQSGFTVRHRQSRKFGDFEIDCVSRADLVEDCISDINRGSGIPRLIFDANGHALSLARTDEKYKVAAVQADIIHADGGFLVSLSKFFSGPRIPERSATTDMIHDFAEKFQKTRNSFYLLGSDEETNLECAKKLLTLYPNLRIVGRHHGFFTDGELDQIASEINACKPDVVWVGLGKPREQMVSLALKKKINATWIITCGGCFNFITGAYSRAPKWMQDNNIEWLHRLATNPRKLFFRYLVTTPHALWISLVSSIKQ